ncbi:MAG TPA: type II secretion system F family protein [Sphingomicrobium sp.]|jgi:MSHA biogenesis protein MshG|nr:type II secretion system F family protein [Sphingomicrobium sp.]
MQTYLYEGRNKLGERMNGRIESASPQAVAKWLLESDIAPTRIRELPKPAEHPEWLANLTGANKVPILELQLLTRQLANMVRAGMPLLLAIEGIQRSTNNKALSKALLAVRADMDRGSDLSTAFARHPNIFDDFYVNMVRVGEGSGRLDEAFRALYKQSEFDRDLNKKVKSAVRYPTFVMGALAIGMSVLMLFVIPVFAETYKNLKADLPEITKVLIAISEFSRHYWWLLLGAIGGGFFVFGKWTATERGRYLWDRTKLSLPVIGNILKKAAVAKFCRNFAIASRSGVPLVPSMELAARVVGNSFYSQRILQMRKGVERGESFTRVATTTGIFSSMELQMISVGEATGEVAEMMEQIATIHSEDVTYEVSKLSETIEPILLGIMGIMVGTLLLGVFTPLWNLGQAALHPAGH